MTIRALHRPPLAVGLVDQIAGEILGGELPPGTMLPTESQLCAHFGVSRTVVREAMGNLQRAGLIRIRQGHGTVVLARSHWRELDPDLLRVRAAKGLIQDLLPDLLAIRRMVEVEVAVQAALLRTDDDLARIAGLIEVMNAAGDSPVAQTDADVAFHEALIVASGNRLLREMMRPINELRRIGSIMTTTADPGIIPASIAGHQAIFAAIAAGDASAAREAMALHIGRFEHELFAALTGAGSPTARAAGG